MATTIFVHVLEFLKLWFSVGFLVFNHTPFVLLTFMVLCGLIKELALQVDSLLSVRGHDKRSNFDADLSGTWELLNDEGLTLITEFKRMRGKMIQGISDCAADLHATVAESYFFTQKGIASCQGMATGV